MGSNRRIGMLCLQLQKLRFREGFVNDANARPQQHIAAEFAVQIAAKMPVRAENDLLLRRNLRQNRFRAGRGDDYV